MRGHGRQRVADRYLAALPGNSQRSASASNKSTKTKATEASSPFGTPLREDESKSPDWFAGPSRAPRRGEDSQAEDLRQYRQRRTKHGSPLSASPGRTSKRRFADPQNSTTSTLRTNRIIDFEPEEEEEDSIGSRGSNEVSRANHHSSSSKPLRPTLNQVVEKGLEFIFDSTACAAPPPVPPRSTPTASEMEQRKTFAAWKQHRVTSRNESSRPTQRPTIPPLSPTQSDLTGIATEVVTNRAYDVAMKRIQQINTGVQDAKLRLDRERGSRYYNKEMKSLVSVSSNDESSVLRPPTGRRKDNLDQRMQSPSLQMPVLHPPMQRKTYKMPPGSADLCLSPPSIVRQGSSRSVDPQSPDPIFSAKSFSIRSPGSLDASFVSDDAMFMEKTDRHDTINVPSLDHAPLPKPTTHPPGHSQGRSSPGRRVLHRSHKGIAAVPIPSVAEVSPETFEEQPSGHDNRQTSVAKAFLQAVARKRGGPTVAATETDKPMTLIPREKPSISTKLNSPRDPGRTNQNDQASVDVKSIRSIFESKDANAAVGGKEDEDDDTASVKSLKEIFEPSRKKDGPSVSSIGRLRAKFDSQPKSAPKGKFSDNDSVAKRSFALFEERSRKHSAPLGQTGQSKPVHRPNDPPVEKKHEDTLGDRVSEASEVSPEPIFVGTIEDTNSKATNQSVELSDDRNNSKGRNDDGLVNDRPVRRDPPPMWMGHREIVLSRRFQIGNTDTFHLRSSEGFSSNNNKVYRESRDQSIAQSNYSQSGSEFHIDQVAKTEPDINDRSTDLSRAENEGIQQSDAPSSTDRAQDDGYLPETKTSSFKGSERNQGTISGSFESSESSDYSDGVTLDASIMEVSVLTNPTELVSKESRQRQYHDDSDESVHSTKKSKPHAETSPKHSEASSSQPSISAVPLLSKLMTNFPQSDEFSAIASKHDRLKRVWSQSQYESKTDDKEIDRAFGYGALDESDDIGFGWDLHHVETILPPSEYVTDWEPFESSPRQKAKHSGKATSTTRSQTSHRLLREKKTELAASTVDIRKSTATSGSTANIRTVESTDVADPGKSNKRQGSLPTQDSEPKPTSSGKSSNTTAKTTMRMIPQATQASTATKHQSYLQSSKSKDDRIVSKPGLSGNSTGLIPQHGVDNSLKTQEAITAESKHASYSSFKATPASQNVTKNRRTSEYMGDIEKRREIVTIDKGISPVQSYLKAWRRTLEESKKSPGNRQNTNRLNQGKIAGFTRTPTQSSRYNHRNGPTETHSPKLTRQRSLNAEEKDVVNPTSNAKDSPRARDFEARSIRRLRMRQMIDLFEAETQDRPSRVLSDTNVPRAGTTKNPKSGRHAFYPATNPTSVSTRSFPRSDPGTPKQWIGDNSSLRARAVKSLIAQRASEATQRLGPRGSELPHCRIYQTPSGSKTKDNSSQSTPSPRTPRAQRIQRFRERLPPDNFGDISASPISGDKTPTRSNISSQHNVSDHSATYDIMPYLLPDFEAARPSNRQESSIASLSSAIRSDAPPTSLASDIAGYTSASVGSSGVHVKSVVGASGHPAYRPKYTALRNRLKSLRESRLRREHNKQEFMASPTGVMEAHPPSLPMTLTRQRDG